MIARMLVRTVMNSWFQERKRNLKQQGPPLNQRSAQRSAYSRRWKWRSRRGETPNQEFLMSESGTEAKVSLISKKKKHFHVMNIINVLYVSAR